MIGPIIGRITIIVQRVCGAGSRIAINDAMNKKNVGNEMTNDHCSSNNFTHIQEEAEGEWEKENLLRTLTGCLVDGVNECEGHLIDRVSVIEVGCGERSMKHCALVHVMLMARMKRETFDRMRQPTIDVIDEVLFDSEMQYRHIIHIHSRESKRIINDWINYLVWNSPNC